MTTQLSMPTEAIECPLCLGEGKTETNRSSRSSRCESSQSAKM